jgi:tRNA nucleotidyltransferase (CCA-adding enzyme)
MLKVCLEVLKIIENNGFECYLVGGFVRDYYIKKETLDVDICTNARPKDLIKIFKDAELPKEKYGAVTLFYKNIRFEMTTFRKEIAYKDRRPMEIEYIDNFFDDIKRRDFTINTLCMNSKGEIIDILNGKRDIDNKVIRVVGNANIKFSDVENV